MAYQDLFARCRLALKMNDVKLAEQLALQILESDQEDASAYILIGNVYTAKGEINRAIQSYQRSIELFPNNPEGYNNIGLIYRKEGNLPAAQNALQKAFSLASGRADISYNLGNICRAQGNNAEAIGYFRKAVEIDPEFILGYNSLALASQREGKTADAINYFNQALLIDANHPTIRLNLGSLEEQNGNYVKALEHYKIAVRSKPSWPIGLKNLAGLQYGLKKYADAGITYEKLVSLSPRDMEARLNLISCISETGNKSQALLLLRQILAEHRENTHAMELVAKINVEMENLEEAENMYRSILAVSPDLLDVRINLAELFVRSSKYAEAAEQLQYVLSKDKSRPRAYYIMGRMARQQRQTVQAIDSFELLMSLDPHFTEGRFQLANLYRDQKQYDKAIKQLNILLSADKTNVDAKKLIAILYYEQKKYSESLTHFTALYYEQPKDEFIIESIKKCYEALGETDKAVRFAESLLQAKGGTADVLENLDQLQQTLSMYESIVDTMPEDFNRKMSRNIQRLLEEDVPDDAEQPQEESLYLQDIHEIAGEYVPIIDVGGIEPVIAVNEEDKETIFLDEMEEALEEYPELDEEPEEVQKFEGRLKGGDGQGPAAPPQPAVMQAPAAAPQPSPTLLDKNLGRSAGTENRGMSDQNSGTGLPDMFPPSGKEPSFMPPQRQQAARPAAAQPSPAPASPSSQQVQGGSVSISVPSVITIKTETESADKGKKKRDKKKKRKDKKSAKDREEDEKTEKTSTLKIPLGTGQPQALSSAQASASGGSPSAGKTAETMPRTGGKPPGNLQKPVEKPEGSVKKKEPGKPEKRKKEKKPSFFQRLRKKAEENKKEGPVSEEKRKTPAKEKTDAQKREDLFTYLANLTQFLPADAKKDFQKSGVMNKIERLSNKFERKGDFKKQIETLFPEKQKPVAQQPDLYTDGVTGDKIVDTLAFMTKLTEHLPQKPETLAIQEKIEHILSTIKRGKDGSK